MQRRLQDTGNLSSDLALERRRADTTVEGVKFSKEIHATHIWERIRIESTEGEKSIGRPMGRYDTLTTESIDKLDSLHCEELAEVLADELSDMIELAAPHAEKLLIVGLGNRSLTPDSIGPRAAEQVNATLHMSNIDNGSFGELGIMKLAVFCPGVTEQSGIESAAAVGAICDMLKPDAVIAIDALASLSPERLGRTFQICDTGIHPGGGIGEKRMPLTKSTLGAPVIAIGVPTVVRASAFGQHSENKKSDPEPMFVSPREIDGIAAASAKTIALGINMAFGIV